MGKRIRLAVIFGGRSAEHKISLLSSVSVINTLDRTRYDIVRIGIDPQGQWFFYPGDYLWDEDDPAKVRLRDDGISIALAPGTGRMQIFDLSRNREIKPVDAVFPVLHGPYGEDGTMQGLLKIMGVPFVGCDVLGSALCMDKVVAKKILQHEGIPTPAFLSFLKNQKESIRFEDICSKLGMTVFVKPANLGSSVGINRVNSEGSLIYALETAFKYDNKIIIEEAVPGREIECSVLGNDRLTASVPGEIVVRDDFYSYKAKYLDENGALLLFPASLEPEITARVQELAKRAYRALSCRGMARVDFFLKEDGTVLVNELNTIPGFTRISMYPRLMELSGVPYRELLDRLIELGFE